MCKAHKSNSKDFINHFDGIFNKEKAYDLKNKDDIIELHKQLWTWLSENPSRQKEDWPGWTYNDTTEAYLYSNTVIKNLCFCCQYTDLDEEKDDIDEEKDDIDEDDCDRCPLKWPGDYCEDETSPFERWKKEHDMYFCDEGEVKDLVKIKALCLEIVNLPIKE